jgi:hypothetical protein
MSVRVGCRKSFDHAKTEQNLGASACTMLYLESRRPRKESN